MFPLIRRLKQAGACHSEAKKFAGLSYAKAYRKAVRTPWCIGWFIRKVVSGNNYDSVVHLGLRLQYGRKPTPQQRAAGRRVIRVWAAKNHIKL